MTEKEFRKLVTDLEILSSEKNELLEDAKTDESQLIQDIRKISGEIIEEL